MAFRVEMDAGRKRRAKKDCMFLSFLTAALLFAEPEAIPVGKSEIQVTVRETPLTVYTYKPETYRAGPMIMVFHGVLRNAEEYRDHAVGMGDRFQTLIVAPKFDSDRFPRTRYQSAGIIDEDGNTRPGDQRTGHYIPLIAEQIRQKEQREQLPYYLIGHSAGGQFLARTSAFVDTKAKRIVAANPGTHLFPVKDAGFPLGFGSLSETAMTDEQLQHYLAQPLTFYLGTGDILRDEYLDVSPESDLQGKSRFERGTNAYLTGKRLAEQKGWKFGWRLVMAEGVDHDHEKMFNHAAVEKALFGEP